MAVVQAESVGSGVESVMAVVQAEFVEWGGVCYGCGAGRICREGWSLVWLWCRQNL